MSREIVGIIVVILSFLLGSGIFWRFWPSIKKYCKKKFYKTKTSKINVIFAFEIPQEDKRAKGYFNELRTSVVTQLKKCGITDEFVIEDFSNCCHFKNNNDAEKYTKEKSINILIWGRISSSMKDKGEEINMIDLKFSFNHRSDEKGILAALIKSDVNNALKESPYEKYSGNNSEKFITISEKDSFNDIRLLSKKISFLSLYISTLILKISGAENSIERCIKVYEKVLATNKKFEKEKVLPHLMDCYEVQVLKFSSLERIKEAYDICIKLVKINPRNQIALSGISLFAYKLEKLSESKQAVKECYLFYPQSTVAVVNSAFVDIIDKKYKNAFKKYKKIDERKRADINWTQVNKFFEDELSKKDVDPAFLYANAMVYKFSGNDRVAANDFYKFLNRVDEINTLDRNKYKEMYRDTKKQMKELKINVIENNE